MEKQLRKIIRQEVKQQLSEIKMNVKSYQKFIDKVFKDGKTKKGTYNRQDSTAYEKGEAYYQVGKTAYRVLVNDVTWGVVIHISSVGIANDYGEVYIDMEVGQRKDPSVHVRSNRPFVDRSIYEIMKNGKKINYSTYQQIKLGINEVRKQLSEKVKGDVQQVQRLATQIIHHMLLQGEKPKVDFKYNADKILSVNRVDYRGALVSGDISKIQKFILNNKKLAQQYLKRDANRFPDIQLEKVQGRVIYSDTIKCDGKDCNIKVAVSGPMDSVSVYVDGNKSSLSKIKGKISPKDLKRIVKAVKQKNENTVNEEKQTTSTSGDMYFKKIIMVTDVDSGQSEIKVDGKTIAKYTVGGGGVSKVQNLNNLSAIEALIDLIDKHGKKSMSENSNLKDISSNSRIVVEGIHHTDDSGVIRIGDTFFVNNPKSGRWKCTINDVYYFLDEFLIDLEIEHTEKKKKVSVNQQSLKRFKTQFLKYITE